MTELEKKQKTIIDHYGIDKQLDMLVEECAELIQAICKRKRYKTEVSFGNIAEEMADVLNLIEQILLVIDDDWKTAIAWYHEYKINRQLERISLEGEGLNDRARYKRV